MDSIFLHQKTNDLVKSAGTRDIRLIAENVGMQVDETHHFKDLLGLLSFCWDTRMVFINERLHRHTKQMICGHALGLYMESHIFVKADNVKNLVLIKDSHLSEYKSNAFTFHLMLDSDEVYHLTKQSYDAAQIAQKLNIHLNLVMVKILELFHMGYDLRHYYESHRMTVARYRFPAYFELNYSVAE